MGRPKEHDAATAERLLDAAEELLGRSGIDSVTVRAVADAVGVSVRAVYATHGGKDELVSALVGRAFDQLAARVESLTETSDPFADLAAAGIDGFRSFALDHPDLYRLTFEQVLGSQSGRPPWAAAGERARSALEHWARRAAAASPSTGTDVDSIVVQFHSICQGLASAEVNGVWRSMGVRDPDRMWRETISAYVGAITGSVVTG